MNKLLSALILSAFAAGAAVAADAAKPVDLKPAPAVVEAPKQQAEAPAAKAAEAKPAKKHKKAKKAHKAKKHKAAAKAQ